MDGGTRVVSACFGFESATSMEIPFAADKLEEALLWFDHGFREEQGGLGIMLDPRKGEDEAGCIWERGIWICGKDRPLEDINDVAGGDYL